MSRIISKPHLKEENLLIDNKLNNKMIKDKFNKHHYNTSFNKNNIYNSTNNSIYLDKKDFLIEDSLKPKEQTISSKKDEINIEKEKEKQKIKEIKLAKLGKIFKNLEQENNIINAIKEQFLEWSNNNKFDLRKSDNRNLKESGNKKYGIKTFDMKFMFNNSLNEDIQNTKENKESEIFEENLNNFRIKLITFSLKNYDKNENKYESRNDKHNNDNDNDEDNLIDNKSSVIDDKYDNETKKEEDVDSLNKKEKENDEEEEEDDAEEEKK